MSSYLLGLASCLSAFTEHKETLYQPLSPSHFFMVTILGWRTTANVCLGTVGFAGFSSLCLFLFAYYLVTNRALAHCGHFEEFVFRHTPTRIVKGAIFSQ